MYINKKQKIFNLKLIKENTKRNPRFLFILYAYNYYYYLYVSIYYNN